MEVDGLWFVQTFYMTYGSDTSALPCYVAAVFCAEPVITKITKSLINGPWLATAASSIRKATIIHLILVEL